jgi:hypothetical protein
MGFGGWPLPPTIRHLTERVPFELKVLRSKHTDVPHRSIYKGQMVVQPVDLWQLYLTIKANEHAKKGDIRVESEFVGRRPHKLYAQAAHAQAAHAQ